MRSKNVFNYMAAMNPSTIMPPPTCDNYKAKKCILGHIWLHRDLELWLFDPKIWSVHPCPKVRSKFGQIPSTNIQDILLTMFVWSTHTDGGTNTLKT